MKKSEKKELNLIGQEKGMEVEDIHNVKSGGGCERHKRPSVAGRPTTKLPPNYAIHSPLTP